MKRSAVVVPPIQSSESVQDDSLPQERSVPSEQMMDYTWLIYGVKGIGKTSLASRMDSKGGKVLFCLFEPGGRALEIYRKNIASWKQFQGILNNLEKDRQGFDTIVIDPGNIAYKRCLSHVCEMIGISHPGAMKDYGASWDRVMQEFQIQHTRIAAMDMGFVVIAHEVDAEKERRNGPKFHKTVPVMSGSTEEFYAGVVDILARYEYIGADRFLRIRGDEHVEAKCRLDFKFLTPAGEPIIRIPMGRSADEAFRNVQFAFDNKQTETYADL
jgi:hypothetical protein